MGAPEAAARKLILITEDEAEAAEILSLLLEMEGYAVSRAVDGIDGLKRLEAQPHTSLIILDLRMPNMDGREFLRTLRHNGRFSKVPVIVTSAWPVTALDHEVQAIITKPVDFDTLLTTVKRLLANI